MANRKQLAILKQGVAAWNKWREEHPDAKIDLRGAGLSGLDLSGANFSKADIRGVDFKGAYLVEANFNSSTLGSFYEKSSDFRYSKLNGAIFNYAYFKVEPIDNIWGGELSIKFSYSILYYSSWKNIIVSGYYFLNLFRDTTNNDDSIIQLLICGNAEGISLEGKNLQRMRLVEFDLRNTDLRGTDLRQADLSRADITGAKLWGSARENWIINGIRCDYIYWDEAGEQRTPPDRDFRPGEFEELYKQLPTFEYIFEQGFTPLDPLIMDRVVQAINKQHKEFQLTLINFDKRGQPHATFTVCHLEHMEKAKQQIAAGYEESRIAPEQQKLYEQIIFRLLDQKEKSLDIIKQLGELAMGDTIYNISVSGGQIAAVGTNASASGNIFQQITADLSRVHEEMQRTAKNPEQRAAADDVAKAAQAAQQQNEPAVRQHLKNAGKFALDCAQKIGAEALAEYLKKMTLGM